MIERIDEMVSAEQTINNIWPYLDQTELLISIRLLADWENKKIARDLGMSEGIIVEAKKRIKGKIILQEAGFLK